jgi:glycosyltransferase involved in cell wall biosynthesis
MSSVDVVIPCYNYSRYLPGCVQSIISQEGVSLRVLIIDDASSDDTPNVGRALASSNPCIEFRRHEKNKGHIQTYNEGLLEWSTADYAVLISADDLLTPGCLSRAVGIMNADESIGMVYGRPFYFQTDNDLPTVNKRLECRYTHWSGAAWLEGRCRAGHNVISSPEVVVRGRVQRAVGGYRPELPHAGDLEMWLRIAAVSNIAYVRGVPQAFYRVHQGSMFRTTYKGYLVDLKQRKCAFNMFFAKHQHMIADADRLNDLSNRALAREALWSAYRAYDRDEVKEAEAEELAEFAEATYRDTSSLSEYAALRRRRRLGARFCHRTQVFAGTAAVKRARKWLLQQRWKREGV